MKKKITISVLAIISLYGAAVLVLTVIGNQKMGSVDEGVEPRYRSSYTHTNRSVRGFDVDTVTKAPLQIVAMVRLNAAPHKVFPIISKNIHQWVEGIDQVVWEHSKSEHVGDFGAGSVRSCSIGGDTLTESIFHWEEDHVYAFNIDESKSTIMLPPTKDRLNVLIVEPDGGQGSLVTWRFYFNKKIHPMSPIVGAFMKMKFINPSLQNLVDIHGGEVINPVF